MSEEKPKTAFTTKGPLPLPESIPWKDYVFACNAISLRWQNRYDKLRNEKDAEILHLRELLKFAHDAMMNWFSSEYANNPKTLLITKALQGDPPPVVPLENLRPLIRSIDEALKEFASKHPL